MKKKIIVIVLLCLISSIIYDYQLFFHIETYISSIDKDNDGKDDQSDILQNVRLYTSTKPKYKSRYYSSGYPDDGYCVCSDVVGFGLLNAGYNLQE